MNRYNIVYIHTHDTGRVIEPYGYNVKSDNIKDFFNNALTFQNAYSVSPTCSPSRAALLTGKYPHQVGMLGLAQRGFELNKEKHIANYLKSNGYYTVLSGVQHESYYYTDHDKAYKELGYIEDVTSDASKYAEEDLVIWDKENSILISDWIKKYNNSKPFFISFGLHGTHRKFPEGIDESFNINESIPPNGIFNNPENRKDFAKYKTSLKLTDDSIGRVINSLKDNGYFKNTIIFITTDHGIAYPFNKCTLRDDGVGIMLAFHVPDNVNTGKTYDGLISQIDIFPTLCDLANLDKPKDLEGKSFARLFKNNDNLAELKFREAIFTEINFHTSYEPVRSVRTVRYKYIKYFDETYDKYNLSNIDASQSKEFLMKNGFSKIHKEKELLYDLYIDPNEGNNLVNNSQYKDVLENLRKLLLNHMIMTDDPLLKGPIEINPKWKVNKQSAINASSKNQDDYIRREIN